MEKKIISYLIGLCKNGIDCPEKREGNLYTIQNLLEEQVKINQSRGNKNMGEIGKAYQLRKKQEKSKDLNRV